MENPDTRVTYFRTSLDPLDIYYLDEIITNQGSDNDFTPAAALATHLRSLNPDLRWNTTDLAGSVAAALPSANSGLDDIPDNVILDAVSFETEGSAHCFMSLRRVFSLAPISRSIWFASLMASAPADLPRATTTGINLGGDPRAVPVEMYSTASGIARMTGPVEVDVSIKFRDLPRKDTYPVVELAPVVPTGFTPVGWTDEVWRNPELQTPGRDITADVVQSAPSAFVSAVAQGADYASLVEVYRLS